jgi:hypothetical protein
MIGFLKFLCGLFYLLSLHSCGYPPQDFLLGIIFMVLGTVALIIGAGMENKQDAKENSEVDETLEKF